MHDVIIIGAGFAGLTAARTILKAASNARVLVIEAQSRIGGRCLTSSEFPGPVDIGCSWIHGYKEGSVVRELTDELGVKCYVPNKGKSCVISAGNVLDADLVGKLSKNMSSALAAAASATSANAKSTSSLAQILQSSSPLFATLGSSLETHLATSLARTLEIGMGVQLEDVSLQWFGYEDSAKGTDAAIVGGYDVLVKKLAEEVEKMGGEVRLGVNADKVELVDAEQGDASVKVNIENGDAEQSRLVLSTIPLSLLQKSHSRLFPAMSSRKAHAIEFTHVGKLGKIVLSYEQAWWPTDVGVFTVLPSQQPKEGSDDAASLPKNNFEELLKTVPLVVSSFAIKSAPENIQPPPATHPTLLVYLPVPVVEHLEGRPAEEVGQAVHNYLAASLPSTESSRPSTPSVSVLTNWTHDPHSLGATSTPLTVKSVSSGITPVSFIELGRPESLGARDGGPRVLFAGEHTSVNNRGSVTGAVESGLREGRRAVQLLGL